MNLLAYAVAGAWLLATSGDARQPPVVVVELFTSEGCSSCPPADDVLRELVRQQPVNGVVVIGIGEHVDYWNGQGWRDPFSSAAFTARQSEYDARVFHSESIYTPQMVVDGRLQVLGSDRVAVHRAIADAAQGPKAAVRLRVTADGSAGLRLEIQADIPAGVIGDRHLDVVTAIVEHGRVTRVQGGENHGRTLEHAAVARAIRVVGDIRPSERMYSAVVSVPLDASWQKGGLEAVVWLQGRETRHIVGAASGRID